MEPINEKKKKKKERKKERKDKKYIVEVIHTIPQYRMAIESYPVFLWTPKRYVTLHVQLECSVDSLRYIKWRRNNHSSIHVNWNPILYGFRACAKSIRYSLNIA